MDDKVVLHRYFIPMTYRVYTAYPDGDIPHDKDLPFVHDDLVRLYPFPPKDEKGEYNPPICMHDGVSEIRYASGRVVKVLVKGCHTKDKDDKSPCTTILEDTHAGESG